MKEEEVMVAQEYYETLVVCCPKCGKHTDGCSWHSTEDCPDMCMHCGCKFRMADS